VDALLTVAEIAGTFAGLVALASLIKTRPRGDVYLIAMIETSIVALVFALMPVLLASSGEPDDSVLRPCAGVFLVTWSLLQVRGYRLSRISFSQQAARRLDVVHTSVMVFVQLAGIVLPAILLSPWLPDHSMTLYSIAILSPLLCAVSVLWMAVREIALG
jgi:hypothetical protein